MSHDESLVGCLALALSMVFAGISLGPWLAPYRVRSFANIQDRYGKLAARLAWMVFAILTGASGLAILNQARPSFSAPEIRLDQTR